MKTLAVVSFSLVMSGGLVMLGLIPAQAQDRAPNACWDAVSREARGMLNADRLSRTSYALAQTSPTETQVTGVGQADGRAFSYRCTYNQRNGQTYSVSLRREGGNDFGNNGGGYNRPDFGRGPGGGPDFRPERPIDMADARRAAEQTCYDATLAYAQRQNPTASNFKIFLSQNRFSQQGREDVRVAGRGELRQLNRQRVQWDYDCLYNARNGRVRDIALSNFIPNR